MFDIFTSRNVKKKSFNIHSHVRPKPKCPDLESVDSQICRTFWEEYVGPESMIVDTLGVYCIYMLTILQKQHKFSVNLNSLLILPFSIMSLSVMFSNLTAA